MISMINALLVACTVRDALLIMLSTCISLIAITPHPCRSLTQVEEASTHLGRFTEAGMDPLGAFVVTT